MSEGYKVKIKGRSHKHKKPFFCPHCRRPTGTIDDPYVQKLGICSVCFVMHVDERSKPDIDLSRYAPYDGLFYGMSKEEIDAFFLSREK